MATQRQDTVDFVRGWGQTPPAPQSESNPDDTASFVRSYAAQQNDDSSLIRRLGDSDQYDIPVETQKGNVKEAMAVANYRKSLDKRGSGEKLWDGLKELPTAVSDFVGGIGEAGGNALIAARESAAVGAEMRKAYDSAIAEGKTPDEAREIASQVSSLSGDIAKQQLAAAAQLGSMEGFNLLDKAQRTIRNLATEASPIGAYRDIEAFAKADGGLMDRLKAAQQRRVKSAFGDDLTPEEEEAQFIREQMIELQRRELMQGKVAGLESLNLMTPEELEQNQDLIDSESIGRMSNLADVTNALPFGVTGRFGRTIAGQALKQTGRAAEGIFDLLPAAARKIPKAKAAAKYAGGLAGASGVTAAIMDMYRDPSKMASYGLAGLGLLGVAGLSMGGRRLGRIVREAGEEALDPNFISASGRKAAERLARPDSNLLTESLSFPANVASGERLARSGLTGAAQGALESGALAATYADDLERFGAEIGAGLGLGGLFGASLGVASGDSARTRRDYANILGEQGAAKKFGTGFDDAHAAGMQKLSPDDQRSVNQVRGWMSQMPDSKGSPIQVYTLDMNAFADAIAADGQPREHAARGEAYTTKDGSKIFVNVDAVSRGGVNAQGHEIMHVAQTALNSQIAPRIMDKLATEISANLYDADGAPNAAFDQFIRNRFGDVDNVTMKDAENEFVAEVSRNVMGGADISTFAMPESLRRKVKRGASRFFQETFGIEPKKGTTFNGQEIAMNFDAVNDVLFDLGRIARESDQAGTGAGFRIEQLDAELAKPIPENVTTEQLKERENLRKERERLIDEVEESLEYPEYRPPESETSRAREAYLATIPEKNRERATAEFNQYAKALQDAGLSFPQDIDLPIAVTTYLLNGQLTPPQRFPRRQTAPLPEPVQPTQQQPGPVEPQIVSEDGSFVDPNTPPGVTRIVRPQPDAIPMPEVSPEQATRQPAREGAQTGESIINEYVEIGDVLSDPLPPDATADQIADRRRLVRRRAALAKSLRNELGIDPSQLDSVFPDETTGQNQPEVSGVLPEPELGGISEAETPPSLEPEVAPIPEVPMPEPPPVPEPESQANIPMPDEEAGGIATEATPVQQPNPIPDLAETPNLNPARTPITYTPEQFSQIEVDVSREIGQEYTPGRKRADRVNHDVAKLRREKLAQRHAASHLDPNLSDAVTWRVDPLTGKGAIMGRRFIEGDSFNDLLLAESGLDANQQRNQRIMQDLADQGRAIPIIYDSAAITTETRAGDQAASTAAQRAKAEAPSTLKRDVFFLTGYTVNNPVTPSAQAGKVTANGVSYDRLAGNVKKIDAVYGPNSPYPVRPDGSISPDFLLDFQNYALNQRNGWRGDGTAPIQGIEGVPVSQNPDFIPALLGSTPAESKRRADFINLAMNDESATGQGPRAEQRRQLAQANDGFLTPEGVTNPLRERLTREGKLPALDRASARHAADLIYAVGDEAVAMTDIEPLRSKTEEISGFENVRIPRNDFVSAGFRPANLGGELPQRTTEDPSQRMIAPFPRNVRVGDRDERR